MSSAYIEMECDVDPILIGTTNLLCCMYWANGSSDKLKMEGDAGHPCLEPQPILKISESCPAVTTLAEVLEYKTCIILIKFGPNLNFPRTFHKPFVESPFDLSAIPGDQTLFPH